MTTHRLRHCISLGLVIIHAIGCSQMQPFGMLKKNCLKKFQNNIRPPLFPKYHKIAKEEDDLGRELILNDALNVFESHFLSDTEVAHEKPALIIGRGQNDHPFDSRCYPNGIPYFLAKGRRYVSIDIDKTLNPHVADDAWNVATLDKACDIAEKMLGKEMQEALFREIIIERVILPINWAPCIQALLDPNNESEDLDIQKVYVMETNPNNHENIYRLATWLKKETLELNKNPILQAYFQALAPGGTLTFLGQVVIMPLGTLLGIPESDKDSFFKHAHVAKRFQEYCGFYRIDADLQRKELVTLYKLFDPYKPRAYERLKMFYKRLLEEVGFVNLKFFEDDYWSKAKGGDGKLCKTICFIAQKPLQNPPLQL